MKAFGIISEWWVWINKWLVQLCNRSWMKTISTDSFHPSNFYYISGNADLINATHIMKKLLVPLICLLLGTACNSSKTILQTDLYFGLSIPDGGRVTDSAWNRFVQEHVIPVFSNGFTELQADGKWMDTVTHKMITEPSRIIVVINAKNNKFSLQIDSLVNKYKSIFRQQAVLRVDKKVATISF